MVAAISWYLCLQAFGVAGSVLTSRWLRELADRGYGIGKAIGLALGGFIYWYAVLAGFAQNGTGAALLALVSIWIVALCLPLQHSPRLPSARLVVATELVFLLFYIAGVLLRAYQPDIVPAGGEKFMESMMIHAVLRSHRFPPNDAWLAGQSLSYYYFGYVLISMLTHLSGAQPSVAFNLSSASFIGLTACGAWSLGYALGSKVSSPGVSRGGAIAGTVSLAALMLAGNFGAVLGVLYCLKALPSWFWEWLNIGDLASRQFSCDAVIPTWFYGWWWNWSRVVQDFAPDGRRLEVITESPVFSFILGDIHPHVLNLPFALAVVGIALSLASGAPWGWRLLLGMDGWMQLWLTSMLIATSLFTNAWDVPTLLLVLVLSLSLRSRSLRSANGFWELSLLALTVCGGLLVDLPWQVTFASQVRGVVPNLLNGTRLLHFALMFGTLLFGLSPFLVFMLHRSMPIRKIISHAIVGTVLFPLILATLFIASLAKPDTRELILSLARGESVLGFSAEQIQRAFTQRLLHPWTTLLLLVLATQLAGLVTLESLSTATRFTSILFGVGTLTALGVEFLFVRDLFGTRMNTVFKLYYQTWWLWSIALGSAAVWLWSQKGMARMASVVGALMLAIGMLWAPMAAYARAEGFRRQPTLDGAAYLEQIHSEDAALIRWLNQNVSGAPFIVEASTLGAYEHTGRISAFTGLPTLLGWGGHQHQWRGDLALARERHALVAQVYQTDDPQLLRQVLKAARVEYVIVGQLELARFGEATHDHIAAVCDSVFRIGSSAIYRCSHPL
ncbi:MAG: DUF2298 domain-containing protein [Thermoflexales bacterium]